MINSDLYISLMKLNEICEVYSGYAIKEFNNIKKGLPVIKIGNILTDGTLNLGECQFSTEDINEKYYSKKGDIYVALSGATTGKLGIMEDEKKYIINQRVGIIRLKSVSQNYIKFYLLKQTERIIDEAAGCAQQNISPKQIGEYDVPVFPEKEMLQISDILNNIVCVIKHYKAMIEKYDDLIKARFIEMFGDPQINKFNWNKVNISKIIKGKVSNGYFAKRNDYCENGNVKVLGVANIVNRMYSNVKDLPRTNVTQKDISKFKVQYGDMLFCRSSLVAEGIGKASIIPKDVADNILFECHVIRLPLDLDQCVPEFMQVLSATDYFRNQVIAQSKTATMTTIGQDGILKTNIILPPIYKQKEFELFVQQVDKSREEVKKSLEKTQLLYDSLMQKYFG